MARRTIILDDDDGNHAITLRAPSSLNANYEFSLPSDPPAAGETLVSDGLGGYSFSLPVGLAGAEFIKLTGTNPERWYFYPEANGGVAPVNKTLVANLLYATPVIIGSSRMIDKFSFDCRTAAGGSVSRAGLYRNISDTVPYPSTLVLDGGEFSTAATGYKTTAVSLTLDPGLYWAAFLSNGTPGLNAISMSLLPTILLGHPTTQVTSANYGMGWSIAQAYGALPATFPGTPATATILNAVTDASLPFIAVHFI